MQMSNAVKISVQHSHKSPHDPSVGIGMEKEV